jgi:hypothetical protein
MCVIGIDEGQEREEETKKWLKFLQTEWKPYTHRLKKLSQPQAQASQAPQGAL